MTVLTCVSTGQSISLDEKIASSGEGEVWRTNQEGSLAKIYHFPTPDRVEKLKVMVAQPPKEPNSQLNHISFAWPKSLLKNHCGNCVGFLMPAIIGSVDFLHVYNFALRKKKGLEVNWYFLHATALNVASVIQAIHVEGYVLGDIKPQNLLVNNRALVSVIDTDSFQIRHPSNDKVYRCLVGSEGFTPVELLSKDLSSVEQTESHDRFRLAVIIHLLLFGDQPFKGQWIGEGDSLDPTELLRRGFWPYAPNSLIQPGQLTIPLEIVHPEIQQCFLRCFNDGHAKPNMRPTAEEWVKALKVAIVDLEACSQITNHYHSQIYGKCYWCERAKNLKTDIFPGIARTQAQPPTITTPSQSKVFAASDVTKLLQQKGQEITVVGQVFSTVDNSNNNSSKPYVFIYLCDSISSNCEYGAFRITIYSQCLHKLDKIQGIKVDELKRLNGQYVKILGLLDIYQTKKRCFTQIELKEPEELELITQQEAKRLLGKHCSKFALRAETTQTHKQPSSQIKESKEPKQSSDKAKRATIYYKQGLNFAKLDAHWEAIDAYSRSIRLNSNNALVYRHRGNSYFRVFDYAKAIRDYTKALHLVPNDPVVYYNRGISYEKFGNQRRASEDLQKAEKLGNYSATEKIRQLQW